MTTTKITFNELREAASRARDAAREMESYADSIPGKIMNPLSSLKGGQSSYTATASTLASKKQGELRNRATAYRGFARQVERFAELSQSVDGQVKTRLSQVADQRAEGLKSWEKTRYAIYRALNHSFGSSDAGAIVSNAAGGISYLHSKRDELHRRIYDWFAHGNGKYWLNSALAIVGAITAIVGAVLAFPAGTLLALIVFGALVVSAAVTVATAVVTVMANHKALSLNDTEPGQARYLGSVSSLEDYAKKNTTDAKTQRIAKGVDVTGKIAGYIGFFGSMGTARGTDGKMVTNLSKNNVLKNAFGKIGIDYDGGFNGLKLKVPFGFGDSPTPELAKLGAFYPKVEALDHVLSPGENVLKAINASTQRNYHYDGYSDVKNVAKGVGAFMPTLKGYDKMLGFGHDVIGLVH